MTDTIVQRVDAVGRAGEVRPGEARPGEARPGEARPGEARPGEVGPGDCPPTFHPPAFRLPVADLSDAALAAVTARLALTAEKYDRSAEFPWDGIRVLHEAGLLTVGVAARYGGDPPSSTDLVRLFEALGKGDPSVALIAAMTIFQHVHQAAAPWWPEELYEKVVADSATNAVLLNAIRAEPEWGAPARGGIPATKIRRTESGWVINGHKGFATGSEGLAYHLVWVATEDDDPLLAHAIVPGTARGVEIVRTWDHLGQRATSTHDVIYTDVHIPFENFRGTPKSKLSPEAGAGAGGASGLAVSALYVGVARAAQEFFTKFASERIPTSLGRPIATTERIQSVAGEIETQLVQAEEVLFGLARRIDEGDQQASERALVAKLIATRSAIAAVEAAVAAIGNPGLTRHNPLERHLRDVLSSRVHPPQDDAALLIAGRRVLATYAADR
ncbi:acyl-CoA dehydrogenase family protein [Subtercola vilae]|uniref:Acyl-CoA dehydrogenase n=1 Tax=Subtercola vilae TaxID=2056433 RepID=A0A4T2BTR5_9MICO|nr:acyl-CoA dehydrogenase family protein [Subtercola vilae]TIH34837.1 acyl-CoA dehydrogenase [Subtercola vilae]